MGVVGRRTAELIICLAWSKGAASKILQLTAPALVADLEIEFAIWTKENFACVMIAACLL